MLKQSDNSPDIACKQSYAESHSAQIGYIHGAINGNRTGTFHERKRYKRSNLKFAMDNGKVDRISICIKMMCFIDYSKAFDCVDHPTLWNMMEENGHTRT